MNFLAHLYLAGPTGKSMIGNLLPDFVRGKLPDDLDEEVLAGALNHRRVDRFTDTHPVVGRSKQRIFAAHGIFSGILIDVFYDHILAGEWAKWHDASLADFAGDCYDRMAAAADCVPENMRITIDKMAAQDWLGGYAHDAGIANTLTRMSRRFENRLRRTFDSDAAIATLHEQYDALRDDFNAFFPELITYVKDG